MSTVNRKDLVEQICLKSDIKQVIKKDEILIKKSEKNERQALSL